MQDGPRNIERSRAFTRSSLPVDLLMNGVWCLLDIVSGVIMQSSRHRIDSKRLAGVGSLLGSGIAAGSRTGGLDGRAFHGLPGCRTHDACFFSLIPSKS